MLQKTKKHLFILCLCTLSINAFAGIHLTIRGNSTDNNVGLIGQHSRDLSSSVAFDIGQHFRLGLTHREATTHKVGYEIIAPVGESSTSAYYAVDNFTRVSSNSFDLTVILYYGKLWVPYIVMGAVQKAYEAQALTVDGDIKASRTLTKPLPNAGIGVGLRLNKAFTLKLSYTASPGLKKDDPTNPDEPFRFARDSYTSVGISYNI